MGSLRFEDKDLQRRFTDELRQRGLPFSLDQDGAVQFEEENSGPIFDAAHTIRGSCFNWYLSWWKNRWQEDQFEEKLLAMGLPFQIEYHDGDKVFLLPRRDKEKHQEIVLMIMTEGDECSFCGRAPGEVSWLEMGFHGSAICDICITRLHSELTTDDSSDQDESI